MNKYQLGKIISLDEKVCFGKHRDLITYRELLNVEPSYLYWVFTKAKDVKIFKKVIQEYNILAEERYKVK